MKKNKINDPIIRELEKTNYWEGFFTGAAIATIVIGINVIFYLTLIF